MKRKWMAELLQNLVDCGRGLLNLPADDRVVTQAQALCKGLLSERGEAAGIAVAGEFVQLYGRMTSSQQLETADMLCTQFAPDSQRIFHAADEYHADPSLENFLRLNAAVEPPRQELLRRINMAPNGTATIVRMRQALLAALPDRPHLAGLDADLRHLLNSWFNRGFLQIAKIDWHTPAAILEKLIAHEAVHEIQGWDDLHRRLASDRRCFAFFHPSLRDEPLVFVEVALTQGLAGAISPLLQSPAPSALSFKPDTAVFYSISNCQPGLKGISLGSFLIKQVVHELSAEMPWIRTFGTLSPIPGFRRWLAGRASGELAGLIPAPEHRGILAASGRSDVAEGLGSLLHESGWTDNTAICTVLQQPMLRLCAHYLTGMAQERGVSDPVERFHLGNGARVERIHWLGDTSEKGLKQSGGLMVNYLYDLKRVDANHEAFTRIGQVMRSRAVNDLTKRARSVKRKSVVAASKLTGATIPLAASQAET